MKNKQINKNEKKKTKNKTKQNKTKTNKLVKNQKGHLLKYNFKAKFLTHHMGDVLQIIETLTYVGNHTFGRRLKITQKMMPENNKGEKI